MSELTKEDETVLAAQIETYLQAYVGVEPTPKVLQDIKSDLIEILGSYYPDPEKTISVDVVRTGVNQVSVAISPKGKKACPQCFDSTKLSKYSLNTQPITWVHFCECGWEGALA